MADFWKQLAGHAPSAETMTLVQRTWARRFGVVWLFLLYIGICYVVVLSLAAFQIQERINEITSGSDKLSVWRVMLYSDELAQAELKFQLAQRAFDDIKSRFDVASTEVSQAESMMRGAESVLSSKYEQVKIKIKTKLQDRFVEAPASFIVEENVVILMTSYPADSDELKEPLEFFRSVRAKYIIAIGKGNYLQHDLEQKQKQLEILGKPDFGKDLKEEVKHQVKDIHTQLKFFDFGLIERYLFGDGRYSIITYPPEILILVLVVSMGSLGSMIIMTQVLFSGESQPMTFYLFRPFLGAIVALGVYVVVKAGVVVASDAQRAADGSVPLSPFFVSFVSLISGLMSERAIETIKNAGGSFLRGGETQSASRYARGVKALMEEQQKTVDQLADLVNEDGSIVASWLEEREVVPADSQRIIGAWLGRSVRDLFSDLPAPA